MAVGAQQTSAILSRWPGARGVGQALESLEPGDHGQVLQVLFDLWGIGNGFCAFIIVIHKK